MKRRDFVGTLTLLSAGMVLGDKTVSAGKGFAGTGFDKQVQELLREWCDTLIKYQVNEPANPKVHGMLKCPACGDVIHGRGWETMYPFMHMAKVTGDEKYLQAAINCFEWSKNVSWPDGRWTNDMDPDSWAGITIFGALALAESIHYHGDLLSKDLLAAWRDRLALAMDGYISENFYKIKSGNINYGMTSLWVYNFVGRVLGNEDYVKHSRELAKDVRAYFTEPNRLIFGEGKPTHERSARGLLRVDLGYNVEESLNGLVSYALQENDTELIDLLTISLNSHLEFMLPDGAWDNSWGTRQNKWSYWGSRTSDGCQPAYSMMAERNPAFGAAAFRNLELLKRCTHNGLLHGGLHYVSHGVKPCIHHTFSHAKVLAFLQDHKQSLPKIDQSAPLPREIADGVRTFDDLDVSLVARGPWRATVSAYDGQYTNARKRHIQQATGGSLAVLYHNKVGPLFTASMAEYTRVEPQNTQPQPGEEFALTPRVETVRNDVVYTNLYDLTAAVQVADDGEVIHADVRMGLYDRDYRKLQGNGVDFKISYVFDERQVIITAETADGTISKEAVFLVLPVLSPSGEPVKQVSSSRIEITKPEGTVVLNSSVPLGIKGNVDDRIFNMVPGMECIPILVQLSQKAGMKTTCSVSVIQELNS